jgi:NAD(P)H-hydrate epimerase
MARLLGTTTAEVQEDRIGAAREAAGKWGVIAVLKGANTVVGHPDGRFFINTTGNPGMATGGTGDVLTGIITSFLGQGMSPLDAALAGVYIHGLAGDRASLQKGEWGLTAGDIVETLPLVISEFEK